MTDHRKSKLVRPMPADTWEGEEPPSRFGPGIGLSPTPGAIAMAEAVRRANEEKSETR